MELVLALLLFVAITAAAWGWSQRGDALARERRVREELAAARRTAAWPSHPVPSEPTAEAEPAPTLPRAPTLPSAPPLAAPPSRPAIPRDLLPSLRRHAAALAEADARARRESRPRGSGVAPQLPPPQRPAPLSASLDLPLAEASRTIEQFLDQSSRLRTDLQAAGGAAARVAEAIRAALPLAREAERQAQGLEPFVSALSSFADRLNLLSIDAGLGNPSARRTGRSEEASAELLSLHDEARTLARDLGYRARRAAEAAQRTQEAFLDAGTTSEGAHERASRAREQGEKLGVAGSSLEASLAALTKAADALRLEREKVARALAASESRLTAERRTSQEAAAEAAREAEALAFLGEIVSAERYAAEKLLDDLETLGWASSPP